MVDPGLVGDLAILVFLLSEFRGGDGVPSTNGVEVASDEGRPLLVVGVLEYGDMANKGGEGRVEHSSERVGSRMRVVNKPSMMRNKKKDGEQNHTYDALRAWRQ